MVNLTMPLRRKLADTNEAQQLKRLLSAEGEKTKLPQTLSGSLKGQAKKTGESIFTTALNAATPDQITRTQHITNLPDVDYCIENYHRTQNPLWLWIALSGAARPEHIHPEVFQYLKQAADEFFKGILDQIQSLECVQITPDREVQEAINHLPPEPPPSSDIAAVLGLSQPGKNLFQVVARDIQAVSMAVAIKDLIRRTGCSQEQAYTALGIALGRISPTEGPSIETIRKTVAKGRKLLPKQRAKASTVRSGGKTEA